jgi:hypothetical protein
MFWNLGFTFNLGTASFTACRLISVEMSAALTCSACCCAAMPDGEVTAWQLHLCRCLAECTGVIPDIFDFTADVRTAGSAVARRLTTPTTSTHRPAVIVRNDKDGIVPHPVPSKHFRQII